MPKLTYWVAEDLVDSQCYSLRAKTKKECQKILSERHDLESYGPVHKVTVIYKDAFDLMFQAMGEGRIYEGGE